MRLPHGERDQDGIGRGRFAVILSRPENHENIGLVARAMKNTGFGDLRLVGVDALRPEAFRTAVHSETVLKKARYFPDLAAATESLHLIFAATARVRNTFAVMAFAEAVETLRESPRGSRVGLLFGNERTGLMSEELGAANYVFTLPQASRQPSYNLASAVLLTLFALFSLPGPAPSKPEALPATRAAQDDCIRVVLMKLERSGFIHGENRAHVSEMVRSLFGRLALTDRDRKFLMAVFNQSVERERK
ncbi:MAG TPA: TrmH family RNA methyltransferase [Acidobacteriota bacterium]|nr:TrmH family RNA methyltransferase [Acidobacteriota bacterium]